MTGGIINTAFALVFAITLLAVVWSIVMYYAEIGSEEARKEYKALILGGITTLFLTMCIYALVDWIRGAIGF